jgi:hypothetical protein
VRCNAHMGIAKVDAVMFGMGKGNEEGNYSQHQQNNSNQHQSFHQLSSNEESKSRPWRDMR